MSQIDNRNQQLLAKYSKLNTVETSLNGTGKAAFGFEFGSHPPNAGLTQTA